MRSSSNKIYFQHWTKFKTMMSYKKCIYYICHTNSVHLLSILVCCTIGYMEVFLRDWQHLLICSTYYQRPCFFRNACEFKVYLDLQQLMSFPKYDNDKTWTQITKQVGMFKTAMFFTRKQRDMSSSLINTMTHVYARFCFCAQRNFWTTRKVVTEFPLIINVR